MLKISTTENQFKTDGSSKNFFFTSSTDKSVTSEEFMQEVADNNTTITYADTVAVFSIIKTLLLKHLYIGEKVYLPFGNFFVTASGTIEMEDDDFDPTSDLSDHQLKLHFVPAGSVKIDITNNTKTDRVSSLIKGVPQIRYIFDINGESTREAALNDTVVLKGTYLKFDQEAEDEGVYLVSQTDGSATKMTYYQTNTGTRVAFRVENTLTAGSYAVKIQNRPNSKREDYTFAELITVTE